MRVRVMRRTERADRGTGRLGRGQASKAWPVASPTGPAARPDTGAGGDRWIASTCPRAFPGKQAARGAAARGHVSAVPRCSTFA